MDMDSLQCKPSVRWWKKGDEFESGMLMLQGLHNKHGAKVFKYTVQQIPQATEQGWEAVLKTDRVAQQQKHSNSGGQLCGQQ